MQQLLGDLRQTDPTFLQDRFGFGKWGLESAAADADTAMILEDKAREERDAK